MTASILPYSIGDLIANRFQVVNTLAGGMGVIFLCLDRENDQPVALKTFKPEYLPNRDARDRFLREGATWVSLGRHPHIVHCQEIIAPGAGPEVYMVLEWVAKAEGKRDASLRAWLKPGSQWPIKQVLICALQIARAMKYATGKVPGLVHRDLKPENILLGRDRCARVTDFGLVSTLAESNLGERGIGTGKQALCKTLLTQEWVGTPLYMAPEQWKLKESVDARVDIYAFGCILYELASGEVAVMGRDLIELERAHREGHARVRAGSLHAGLVELVQGCLAKNRDDRYRTWEEVEFAVRQAYRRNTGTEAPSELVAEHQSQAERVAAGWSNYVLGQSYLDLGKFSSAAKYSRKAERYGRAQKNHALESAGLHGQGLAHSRLGDMQQSIKFYRQALAIAQEINSSEQGAILGSIGDAYRDLGEIQQAVGFYERALSFTRKWGDWRREGSILNSIGNLYRRSGSIDRAIQMYNQALVISREYDDRSGEGLVLGNLGICYRNLGDTQQAVKYLEAALEIATELGDLVGAGRAFGNLGNVYRGLGDWPRAVEYHGQALSTARKIGDPRTEGIALFNLGNDYDGLGDTDRAVGFLTEALAIAHRIGYLIGAAEASHSLAILCFKQSRWKEALHHAESALHTFQRLGHKPFIQSCCQLIDRINAQSSYSQQRPATWDEQAVSNRERVAVPQAKQESHADLFDGHIERGWTYLEQGRTGAAIYEFQSALRANPQDHRALAGLVLIYLRQERFDEAIREVRSAIRANPQDPVGHRFLGVIFERLNLIDDAMHEFQAALNIDPGDTEARYFLAVLYSGRKQWTDVISELETVLQIDPYDERAYFLLGTAWAGVGNWDRAASRYQALLQINPTHAKARHHLGVAYGQLDRFGKAIEEFQAAIAIDPDLAEAHWQLGVFYSMQGRLNEAVRELRLAVQLGEDKARRMLNAILAGQ